ncbi:hypothetical protein ACFPZ0_15180 [Streptomonospora nanhaiensis]|uniref:Uncharacterized protein n=1 Tax=Streptomonospora nanhaiensis TaxID=1323731 RepID=A0A853BFV1_9ACTN|nr:hypothetical protein [Streptomonospora nanhaiensis]MBV2366440.1 hypothetical protein [Streptomonospora nanhaiensis]MBX9389279.1 hypothetical protein [Streptomonospora nanhaiensis]NYI94189.1 hypothetical protein [Streptomonospora nanhaiensis]
MVGRCLRQVRAARGAGDGAAEEARAALGRALVDAARLEEADAAGDTAGVAAIAAAYAPGPGAG